MSKQLDLACDTCMHREVCGKKHIFEGAQKDLEQFNTLKILSGKDWIDIRPLKCQYYLSDCTVISHE